MPKELHWRRAAAAVALLGILMVGGYLATSPHATAEIAIGMALAVVAVEVVGGLLFAISRRHDRVAPR